MAVLSVRDIWGSGLEITKDGARNYTVRFEIVTDDVRTFALEAAVTAGLPVMYTGYRRANGENDSGSLLVGYTFEQQSHPDGDPRIWICTAKFTSAFEPQRMSPSSPGPGSVKGKGGPGGGSAPGSGGAGGAPSTGSGKESDPLQKPPDIRWGAAKYQKVVWVDTNGKPIVNSAFENFDPPPEQDMTRLTLTVVRNEALFNAQVALQYADAVNSDAFCGFGSGKVKCHSITGDSKFDKGIFYDEVTYSFEIWEDGSNEKFAPDQIKKGLQSPWNYKPLDQGMHHLEAAPFDIGFLGIKKGDKVPTQNRDATKDSMPLSGPLPLDGHGNLLTVDDATKGKFIFLNFPIYRRLPFKPLKLNDVLKRYGGK